MPLGCARLVSDEGLRKHYLLEREEVTLVDVLGEVGNGRGLKDVTLDEPDIEEVIRTFYQRGRAPLEAVA